MSTEDSLCTSNEQQQSIANFAQFMTTGIQEKQISSLRPRAMATWLCNEVQRLLAPEPKQLKVNVCVNEIITHHLLRFITDFYFTMSVFFA